MYLQILRQSSKKVWGMFYDCSLVNVFFRFHLLVSSWNAPEHDMTKLKRSSGSPDLCNSTLEKCRRKKGRNFALSFSSLFICEIYSNKQCFISSDMRKWVDTQTLCRNFIPGPKYFSKISGESYFAKITGESFSLLI